MLLGMEDEGELLFKMVAFSGGDAVIFGGFFVIPPKMPVQCGKWRFFFLMVKCDYLEPQTSSLKWMFGEFQPFPTSKDLVHHPIETTVYKSMKSI